MEEDRYQQAMAHLSASLRIQADAAHQGLALEWTQMLLSRLIALWMQLDAHEALAYEDKVAAQVDMLEEATSSLWHLHRRVAATRGQLQRHLLHLRPHRHV